jgi:acyl dehydratase
MSSAVFRSVQEYLAAVGQSYGPTDWLLVDQNRINLFAAATGDQQWIHVDPERAADGPFGGTIAHGYLSLALVNLFLPQLVRAEGMRHGINYGCDRVRFPAALRSGSRLRGRAQLLAVEDLGGGALQAKIRVTLDTLSRLYF